MLSRWTRLALQAQKEGEAAQRRQKIKIKIKIKAEQHDAEEFKVQAGEIWMTMEGRRTQGTAREDETEGKK